MLSLVDDGVLSPSSHTGDDIAKATLAVALPTTMAPGLIGI
jgi:hypothetical protein